eukprot:5954203-Prymnesium_polylepis.1
MDDGCPRTVPSKVRRDRSCCSSRLGGPKTSRSMGSAHLPPSGGSRVFFASTGCSNFVGS